MSVLGYSNSAGGSRLAEADWPKLPYRLCPDPAFPAMTCAALVASGSIPLRVRAHSCVGFGLSTRVAVTVAVGRSMWV
jgi:hypothetical protein